MVQCSCGKTIDKIPEWMSGIQVTFVCNNCPNRQHKNIAFVNLEAALTTPVKASDEEAIPDLDEEAEAEHEE